MIKLEKHIKLNSLKKTKRKNSLEDKLGQQEHYGDAKEFFDSVT